jgi:hypothetical protein
MEIEGLTLQLDKNKSCTIAAQNKLEEKTIRNGGTYSRKIQCNILEK